MTEVWACHRHKRDEVHVIWQDINDLLAIYIYMSH